MMKPHCDVCDEVVVEGYRKWVEISGITGEHTYHINVGNDADLCKTCWLRLLSKNVEEISHPPVLDDDIPF